MLFVNNKNGEMYPVFHSMKISPYCVVDEGFDDSVGIGGREVGER